MNKDLECCPYCGCDEYYWLYRITGEGKYIVRFDGEEALDGSLHDGLQYTRKSKYAHCVNCGEELFKAEGEHER